MKKLLFLAAFFLAIGSYGGIAVTNAQTMTSTDVMASSSTATATATLEQQLQVAQATLVNLEMQAGSVPVGDNGTSSAMMTVTATPTTAEPSMVVTPSTSGQLTAAEISSFEGTLTTLVETLGQLNATLGGNSSLTAAQDQAVQSTLNNMASTLVAMTNTINADMSANNAPVAMGPGPAQIPNNGVGQNIAGIACFTRSDGNQHCYGANGSSSNA
jgi:hypothetical protein